MTNYTIAIGCGIFVWKRKLTSKEMSEILASGCESIYEYNSWKDLEEEHPHIKHYSHYYLK